MKNKRLLSLLLGLKIGIIGLLGGFLGAWGGADGTSKAWRRVLIPVLLMIVALTKLHHWAVITIMSMIGALSIGYGIPDPTDKGSALGRFWYNLFNQNHLLADIFTRGTVGVVIGCSLLSIPLVKYFKTGNTSIWLVYALGVVGIILVNALISWRGLGTFMFLGKELTYSEFYTWGLISVFSALIILLP